MSLRMSDGDAVQPFLFAPPAGDDERPLDAGVPAPEEIRRLVPARDDLRPLYVIGQGLSIGKSGEVLQIRERKKPVQEARLNEISQVNLFGNVTLSSASAGFLLGAEDDRPLLVWRKPLRHPARRGVGEPGDVELQAARYQARRAVQIAGAVKAGRRLDLASWAGHGVE